MRGNQIGGKRKFKGRRLTKCLLQSCGVRCVHPRHIGITLFHSHGWRFVDSRPHRLFQSLSLFNSYPWTWNNMDGKQRKGDCGLEERKKHRLLFYNCGTCLPSVGWESERIGQTSSDICFVGLLPRFHLCVCWLSESYLKEGVICQKGKEGVIWIQQAQRKERKEKCALCRKNTKRVNNRLSNSQ